MYHVISEPTPRGPIYLVEDTTTHTRKRGSFDCERSAQAFADYLNEREGHETPQRTGRHGNWYLPYIQ
jgi:hypothetical protein